MLVQIVVMIFVSAIFRSYRRNAGDALWGNEYMGALVAGGLIHSSAVLLLCIVSCLELVSAQLADDTFHTIHNAILCFSGGYFINDLEVVTLIRPSLVFVFHHLLVLGNYALFLYHQKGAYFLTYALFFGEITNPLQGLRELFLQVERMQQMPIEVNSNFHESLKRVHDDFASSFILVRLGVFPCLMLVLYWTNTFQGWPWSLFLSVSMSSIAMTVAGLHWSLSLRSWWSHRLVRVAQKAAG
jgi:hypothetical protein